MKHILPVIIVLFTVVLVSACDEDAPQNEKPKIIHQNSVEYYVESARLADGRIELKTTQDIYVKSEKVKSIIKLDTLPAIGTETVKLEEADKDTVIAKEYDIYFTLAGKKK